MSLPLNPNATPEGAQGTGSQSRGITVQFQNVGRDKLSWSEILTSLSASTLTKAIRRRKALKSRDIDFDWNDDLTGARIVVGGFRHVGDLTVMGGIALPAIQIRISRQDSTSDAQGGK